MIGAETSIACLATPAPEMSTQRSSGRGFPSRGASAAAGRGGHGKGRGSAPGMQTETHTQARVYAVTQQNADAAPDVVTGIISILDHDAYTLVDPGATHSFASRPFLDRFQIETQPLEGRMRSESFFYFDIHFCPLPVAATGTLVEHTLAEIFAHVLGRVMLLHHKRNSHGSLMLGYNGMAGWG